jgi:hypothetical protein
MKIHGKRTEVELGGVELTDYSNNSQLEFTADSHDTTTYGNDSHVFNGGLLNGTATISGFYDSTAVTGPRAAVKPMVGEVVEFVHRPEGSGAGKPQDVVQALVTKYTQTHPVAEYITWAVDLQFSGDVDSTPQAS